MTDIKNYDLELVQRGKQLDSRLLKTYLEFGKTENFLEFAREQLDKSNHAPSTNKSQKRSLSIVEEFQAHIPFTALDEDFLLDLTKSLKSKGYSEGTIWKVHKDLRIYVGHAIRKGYIAFQENPYNFFKNKKPKGKHEFLDYEDLKAFENAKVPSGDFQRCKDIFLFGCYTGLRISDLKVLSGENFKYRDGKLTMTLKRMQKVDKRIFQILDDNFKGKAVKLIEPYLEKFNNHKYIWGFKIAEAEQNAMLKHIQAEAGISINITQHLSRHTFGTLYAKETGDIFKVMQAMGISKFETARIYINLSKEL